ncbi:MAG: hypothetical protein AAGF50_15075 [Pseudomonadota bacterium]
MALWDYNCADHKPELREANRVEEARARQQNGFIRTTDWWAISNALDPLGFASVSAEGSPENMPVLLMEGSPDIRYVAVLLSSEAHLDPYDLHPVFETAEVDGSTLLAHYLQGISDVLEHYYASSSQMRDRVFIKNGPPDWDMSTFGTKDLKHAAGLVGTKEKRFSFECGRKQLLYRALEQDLEHHGVKPDWFIPSSELMPFQGVEPDCRYNFCDYGVFREPPGFERPWIEDLPAPKTKKGFLSLLKRGGFH